MKNVTQIHPPGYDDAGKPSLIAPDERILTDREMRDMAILAYQTLDKAFRLCLSKRYRMILPCDPGSHLVTTAIERFIAEASK